jgi:MFS family permease
MAAYATIGMFVTCAALPLVPGNTIALVAGATAIFFACLPVAVVGAATQLATPSRMRGVVASLYAFTAQILSYGVGLTVIALLTDKVFRDPKMVGSSLQIVTCVASALATLLLFSVLPHHRRILGEMASATPGSTPNAPAVAK